MFSYVVLFFCAEINRNGTQGDQRIRTVIQCLDRAHAEVVADALNKSKAYFKYTSLAEVAVKMPLPNHKGNIMLRLDEVEMLATEVNHLMEELTQPAPVKHRQVKSLNDIADHAEQTIGEVQID